MTPAQAESARIWRTLAALHGAIAGALETALQAEHGLSVVEYTVLDALSEQDGWHLRMQELSRATGLSASATTRLVNRLEARELLGRVLCEEDRRGIYSELTRSGWALLNEARPTHNRVLAATLATDERQVQLAEVVTAATAGPASGNTRR